MAASLTGHGTGDANALAYDGAKNVAYFERNGNLWSVDLTSGAFTQTGTAVGDVAAATFVNGEYVYGTGSALMAVDFSGKGPVTLGAFDKGWSFGDIATVGSTLYGSSGSSTFRVDLGTNAVHRPAASAGHSLQLGFVGSTLYGIANGNAGEPTGEIFTVDLTSGAQTDTGLVARYGGSALAIRDAATYQPTPRALRLRRAGVRRARPPAPPQGIRLTVGLMAVPLAVLRHGRVPLGARVGGGPNRLGERRAVERIVPQELRRVAHRSVHRVVEAFPLEERKLVGDHPQPLVAHVGETLAPDPLGKAHALRLPPGFGL